MNDYMFTQKKKIEIDKWNEGCRIQCDPGEEYIMGWIEVNGGWFRSAWDQSLCKNCCLVKRCGFKLRHECGEFQQR